MSGTNQGSQSKRLTCAGAADDAVVNDRAAVHRDLQAVVGIVVLGGLVIWVELKRKVISVSVMTATRLHANS